MPKFVFLWTDVFVLLLVLAVMVYVFRASRSPSARSAWRSVGQTPSAMCAAVVLAFFVLLGVLDSVHYRPLLPPVANSAAAAQAGRSEEHTSELQSLMRISYAVFCLKKKKKKNQEYQITHKTDIIK